MFRGLREREQGLQRRRIVPASVSFRGRLLHRVLRVDHRGLQVGHRLVSREVVLSTRVVLAEDRYRRRPSLSHSVLIVADPTGGNVDASLELVITVESRGIISKTVPGDK